MGEWTPPTPQQYRGPADPQDGFAAAARAIGDLGRRTRDGLNHLLQAAGIKVTPAGMEVDSALVVNGALQVTGDTLIEGNLAVPNGSITNAALASPVTAAVATPGWASTWSGNASWVDKATATIPVPAGFSQALVIAVASVTTTGSLIRYDIRARIEGSAGPELQNLVDGTDSSAVAHTTSLTGLAGGTIGLAAQVYTAPNLAAHTGNIATVTGCAIFFR